MRKREHQWVLLMLHLRQLQLKQPRALQCSSSVQCVHVCIVYCVAVCALLLWLAGRVEVKVTSSNSSTGPFLKGSAGFSVLPGSKCPRFSKCKAGSSGQDTPAPAAATDDDDSTSSSEETQETNTFDNSDAAGATPRKHPSSDQQGGKDDKSSSSSSDNSSAVAEGDEDAADVGASRPLFFTLNPADQAADDSDSGNGSVGVGALRSGRMCTPSNLGYQCSGNVAEGVVIHYSFGGMPPVNVCTNKTTMDRASRNSSSLMHFAIETEQQVGEVVEGCIVGCLVASKEKGRVGDMHLKPDGCCQQGRAAHGCL